MGRKTLVVLIAALVAAFVATRPAPAAGSHPVAGEIEVLRDQWGVPHIYAASTEDLFYAQGYVAAKDRLFQLDLWRRQNTGHLAEVLGESAIARDRIARLVRFRGNWDAEWKSYSPDTKLIATNFVAGINAYIKSLKKRPVEFEVAGYDPALWEPEDVTARVAGLLMTHNLTYEVQRAEDIRAFGIETVNRVLPPDPFIRIDIPKGLDLSLITKDILQAYTAAVVTPRFTDVKDHGSNNWVVDGTMTKTGRPILANDPHRPVILPSLRKTWHLVAPGWNAFGAGEPALPGVALGHNEDIAWGFTIVNIDQQDLYVEKLNPANPDEYRFQGAWHKVEIEHQQLKVKGHASAIDLELRYTIHGPVIHEDRAKNVAYALKWVGADAGGAGYLPALGLMRAKNWEQFRTGASRYMVPSENLVYADTKGNIGWIAGGFAPVRRNWSGLLPVPGDTGEYEWNGYLPINDVPQVYNPARHYVATANHNILPEGYTKQLSYEFRPRFRFERIREVLESQSKFDIADFERLQQDVASIPARRFQAVLAKWTPPADKGAVVDELLKWDARVTTDSHAALIYELWMSRLPAAMFGPALGKRVELPMVLDTLEKSPDSKAMASSLEAALSAMKTGTWGELHQITFSHPVGRKEWSRGPVSRPGDANTVNATSGAAFRQDGGASYRQIIDLADWDRSVMSNVPGESGDPSSKHYDDLIAGWAKGEYHPMPFSRKAVEAVTDERFVISRKR